MTTHELPSTGSLPAEQASAGGGIAAVLLGLGTVLAYVVLLGRANGSEEPSRWAALALVLFAMGACAAYQRHPSSAWVVPPVLTIGWLVGAVRHAAENADGLYPIGAGFLLTYACLATPVATSLGTAIRHHSEERSPASRGTLLARLSITLTSVALGLSGAPYPWIAAATAISVVFAGLLLVRRIPMDAKGLLLVVGGLDVCALVFVGVVMAAF